MFDTPFFGAVNVRLRDLALVGCREQPLISDLSQGNKQEVNLKL
jgi:hypothetical protein